MVNDESRCMNEWKPYLSVDVHTWIAYGNKFTVFSLVIDWMALNGMVSYRNKSAFRVHNVTINIPGSPRWRCWHRNTTSSEWCKAFPAAIFPSEEHRSNLQNTMILMPYQMYTSSVSSPSINFSSSGSSWNIRCISSFFIRCFVGKDINGDCIQVAVFCSGMLRNWNKISHHNHKRTNFY